MSMGRTCLERRVVQYTVCVWGGGGREKGRESGKEGERERERGGRETDGEDEDT